MGKKKEFFVTVGESSNNRREELLSALSAQMVLDDMRVRKGHFLVTIEGLGEDYDRALERSGSFEIRKEL